MSSSITLSTFTKFSVYSKVRAKAFLKGHYSSYHTFQTYTEHTKLYSHMVIRPVSTTFTFWDQNVIRLKNNKGINRKAQILEIKKYTFEYSWVT